ncbi:MAG: hypothetical protein ACP5FZ_06655 [Fidelibacterota bacterium]
MPNRQRGSILLAAVPVYLLALLFFSWLFYQLLATAPDFVKEISLGRMILGYMDLPFQLIINRQTLISGSVLLLMFIILLQTEITPSHSAIDHVHRFNSLYLLFIAALIFLTADSFLLLTCGMIFVSVVIIYRDLVFGNENRSISLFTEFVILDLLFFSAVLILSWRTSWGSLTEISSSGEVIPMLPGLCLVAPIILKMVRIPYCTSGIKSQTSTGSGVFMVGSEGTLMVFLLRFFHLLHDSCFTWLLVGGLFLALSAALSSIMSHRSESALQALQPAQMGLVLIGLGLRRPVISLLFTIIYIFSNTLLILSHSVADRGAGNREQSKSLYRLLSVLIFLFAATAVAGLLPCSGFTIRYSMMLYFAEMTPLDSAHRALLVLLYLAIMLVAFAAFRYFFITLQSWRNAGHSRSNTLSDQKLFAALLILLNLYPVLTFPTFNPLKTDSWIYRFVTKPETLPPTLPAVSNPIFIAMIVVLAVSFFLTLIIYQLKLMNLSFLSIFYTPFKKCNQATIRFFHHIDEFSIKLMRFLSKRVGILESTTLPDTAQKIACRTRSGFSKIVDFSQKSPNCLRFHQFSTRLTGSIVQFWQNHDIIASVILLLIMALFIIISIL